MTGSRWCAFALVAALSACAAQQDDTPNEVADLTAPLTASPPFDGDPANHAIYAVDISFWEMATSQAEMDCFWDSGVRHVVVGTQVRDITRQQLAMAVRRGMSVDAYVYLYWDGNPAAQVQEAFDRVSGFPIQRMWLDLEQSAGGLGSNVINTQIQQALDTCRTHGVECGFYTGSGFWNDATGNTSRWSDVPMWYAHYDGRTSLSDWPGEHFGAWLHPVARQFGDGPLCGMAADTDVMQVLGGPTVTVDRSPPPDTHAAPVAATGLYPFTGHVAVDPNLKLLADTIARATQYQFAVESWTGRAWTPYYTWTSVNSFLRISLPSTPSVRRFRVRGNNSYGNGAWSDYATFDIGHYTGTRPPATTTPPATDAGTTPPPPPPVDASTPPRADSGAPPPAVDAGTTPPVDAGPPPWTDAGAPPVGAGVPAGLAPDAGILVTTASVTMTWTPVAGATSYDVAIENLTTLSTWATYYTYSGAAANRTFYPQVHSTSYRFRVRSLVAGVRSDWSAYATFRVP